MSHQFEYYGGNLLDWTRFRAFYVRQSGDETLDRNGTALLFDRLYQVLTQI